MAFESTSTWRRPRNFGEGPRNELFCRGVDEDGDEEKRLEGGRETRPPLEVSLPKGLGRLIPMVGRTGKGPV